MAYGLHLGSWLWRTDCTWEAGYGVRIALGRLAMVYGLHYDALVAIERLASWLISHTGCNWEVGWL